MEKETIFLNGANVELIKDDATQNRHIYIRVNRKDVLHLIENEKGYLNIFRYDLPNISLGELLITYERININNVLVYLRKKDFN